MFFSADRVKKRGRVQHHKKEDTNHAATQTESPLLTAHKKGKIKRPHEPLNQHTQPTGHHGRAGCDLLSLYFIKDLTLMRHGDNP